MKKKSSKSMTGKAMAAVEETVGKMSRMIGVGPKAKKAARKAKSTASRTVRKVAGHAKKAVGGRRGR